MEDVAMKSALLITCVCSLIAVGAFIVLPALAGGENQPSKTAEHLMANDDIAKMLTDSSTVANAPEGLLRILSKYSPKDGLWATVPPDGKLLYYMQQEEGKKPILYVLDIVSGKDTQLVDMNDPQFGKLKLLGWKTSPMGDKVFVHVGFENGDWYEYDINKKMVIDDADGHFKTLASYDPNKNNIPDGYLGGPDERGDGPVWGLEGKMYPSDFDAKQAGVEVTIDPSWSLDNLYLLNTSQQTCVSYDGKNYIMFVTTGQHQRAYIVDPSNDKLIGVVPGMASFFYWGNVFFTYENGNLILRKYDLVGNDEKNRHLKVIGINLGEMKLSSVRDYKNLPYMLVQAYDDKSFYWILVDKKKLQQTFLAENKPAPPVEKGTNPPATTVPAASNEAPATGAGGGSSASGDTVTLEG